MRRLKADNGTWGQRSLHGSKRALSGGVNRMGQDKRGGCLDQTAHRQLRPQDGAREELFFRTGNKVGAA